MGRAVDLVEMKRRMIPAESCDCQLEWLDLNPPNESNGRHICLLVERGKLVHLLPVTLRHHGRW